MKVKLNEQGVFTDTKEIDTARPTDVVIYPNPARESIHLEFQNTFSGIIRTRNIMGALVHEEKVNAINAFYNNISTYPAGYYIIQLLESGQGAAWQSRPPSCLALGPTRRKESEDACRHGARGSYVGVAFTRAWKVGSRARFDLAS